jgi:parallel beta-helix repeat protein
MRKAIIFALAFLLLLPLTKANTYLTDCAELNIPGETYYLTADIINSSASTCMLITADNVVLDCQGHTIDGVDAIGTVGINSWGYGKIATIKNCTVTDWFYAIQLGSNNKIQNLVVESNLDGIIIQSVDNIIVKDSFFDNNSLDIGYATTREEMYCHSYFENVTGADNKPILFFNSTVEIKNWDNNVSSIILCGADNSVIDNLGISPTHRSGGGVFVTASNNVSVTNSIFKNIHSIDFDSENGNIFNVSLTSTRYGVSVYSNYTTLKNIEVQNCDYNGIYIFGVLNNSVENVTVYNCSRGFYLWRTNYTKISNSKIQNCTYGIYLRESTNNLIYNNLFNNTNNFYFYGTIYPNYWNTTRQTGTRVYSFGNEIGGNYWTNSTANGYSDTCTDSDKDGFCDDPYVLATDNVDYLALSDEYITPTTTTLPPVSGVPLLSRTLVGIAMGFGVIAFMLKMGVFDIREPKRVVEYFIALAVVVFTVIALIVLFA